MTTPATVTATPEVRINMTGPAAVSLTRSLLALFALFDPAHAALAAAAADVSGFIGSVLIPQIMDAVKSGNVKVEDANLVRAEYIAFRAKLPAYFSQPHWVIESA